MKAFKEKADEVFDFNDKEKVRLFAVMPNLHMEKAVETKYVALLPANDARLQEMAKASIAVHGLVNCFTDEFGEACTPTALVFRTDAPASVLNIEALVSYRNIFAISSLLRAADFTVGNPNVFWPLFSDFFDFYPFTPFSDGQHLSHQGMALSANNPAEGFRGQIQPNLPRTDNHVRPEPDTILYPLLLKAWIERYVKNRRRKPLGKLFRSLAVAYHAASVPKKNLMMGYDFGINIGLWVSAFESLAHPGVKKVNLTDVIELVEGLKFRDKGIQRKRRVILRKIKGKPADVKVTNGVGYLYSRLYRARNAFMHGDTVTFGSIFHITSEGSSLLTRIAPVVFKTALLSYFGYKGRKVRVSGFKEPMILMSEVRPHEKALAGLLSGEQKPTDE